MIDIHTHILPGIDDGSDSAELSQQMLQTLYEDGVRDVVFTPHFYWQKGTVDEFLADRAAAREKISFPGMKLHMGAEVQFSELRIDYSQLSQLCIDKTRYILLELPFGDSWSDRLFDNIVAMRQNTGVTPIIAHIERYPAVHKTPRNTERLLSIGCLLQVNAEAVLSSKGGSIVDVLLKNRQIQALGTDCHNMSSRKPEYGAAFGLLSVRYGKDIADYIQDSMRRILNDSRVRVDYVHKIKKGLFSYH